MTMPIVERVARAIERAWSQNHASVRSEPDIAWKVWTPEAEAAIAAVRATRDQRNLIPVEVGSDGWSEWIHPLPGFRSQCCGCGLIHEWEYRIVPAKEPYPALNEGESENAIIVHRARRESKYAGRSRATGRRVLKPASRFGGDS